MFSRVFFFFFHHLLLLPYLFIFSFLSFSSTRSFFLVSFFFPLFFFTFLHTHPHGSLPLSLSLCPKMGCASGYCGGNFLGWCSVWVCVCVCFFGVVVGWILWVVVAEFYGLRWLWVRQLVVVGLILRIWSPPLIWFDLHHRIGKKLFWGKIVVMVGKRAMGFLS